MSESPQLTLNNGITLPALGLSVFQSSPEETPAAVITALREGYRLIDTAAAYMNEKEVAEGLRLSELERSEVFLETKIWISDYGYESTLHAFEKSARKLGVDQIDLLLLHQPLTTQFDLTIAAYKALEKLYAEGKVRAIGVSNFSPDELTELFANTEVVPAVNQIEVHPYFQQKELQAFHAEHGIITQAWSPIGGITFYNEGQRSTLENEVIGQIATAHDKSPAQIMLRWHLQEGRSAIPKSVKPARIVENFAVFDFELTADDIAAINALDTGERSGPGPEFITLENAGFPIPEA